MDVVAVRLERDMDRVLTAREVPVEDLRRLLQDILQARAAARLRVEIAADQLAGSLLTQTRDLLHLATAVPVRLLVPGHPGALERSPSDLAAWVA